MSQPVPAELQLLGLSCLFLVVQITLVSQLSNRQYGLRWAASPRDETMPPPGVLLARTRRALFNFLETYPAFVAAVLSVAVVRRFDLLTLIGAHLYLWGRVGYLALYMAGVPLVRSLFWNIALVGILMILWRLV